MSESRLSVHHSYQEGVYTCNRCQRTKVPSGSYIQSIAVHYLQSQNGTRTDVVGAELKLFKSAKVIDLGNIKVPNVFVEHHEFDPKAPFLGFATHHDDLGSIYRLDILRKADSCDKEEAGEEELSLAYLWISASVFACCLLSWCLTVAYRTNCFEKPLFRLKSHCEVGRGE